MLSYLAAEAGETDHNPILPIWQEIVIGAIAFALLCFVLMKYVFPRMEEMFQARVDAIEGGIKRAEEAQAEANELLEQYKRAARRGPHRGRADPRRGPGRRRGHPAGRPRPRPGRSPTASSRPAASSSPPSAQSIVRELRAEVGTLAVDLAGRIVGESLADEARRRGTVERFLERARTPAARPAGGADGVDRQPGVVRRRGGAARRVRRQGHGRAASPRSPTRSCRWPALLRREPRLRRALTDPSRVRRASAPSCSRSLLAGKVGDDARRRCSRTLVGGRWSRAGRAARRDRAARRRGAAGRRRAGRRAGRGRGRAVPLRAGRRRRPRRWPSRSVDSTAPAERRVKLVADLLEGKAQPATVRLVELALAGFGGRSFDGRR